MSVLLSFCSVLILQDLYCGLRIHTNDAALPSNVSASEGPAAGLVAAYACISHFAELLKVFVHAGKANSG